MQQIANQQWENKRYKKEWFFLLKNRLYFKYTGKKEIIVLRT